MKNFEGTWLTIKTGNDYNPPEFIEFQSDQIIHFELENTSKNNQLTKKEIHWTEKLSDVKYEFINKNRIRIFRMGIKKSIIDNSEFKKELVEFVTDYERIFPTKTILTHKEIEKLEFKAIWNNEKISMIFNTYLDTPLIQEILKKNNREGTKLILENLDETFFISIYNNRERSTLIGIKEVNNNKAVLFGFPEEPYEIIAK